MELATKPDNRQNTDAMPDANPVIAQRIKTLRRVLGMNQTEFAAYIGVARTTIVNIEAGGQRGLPRTVADKIRQRCHVTTDWLYWGDVRGLPYQLARDLEENDTTARSA